MELTMNRVQKLGLIALLAGLIGCAGKSLPSASTPFAQAALAIRFSSGQNTQALREDIASASIKVSVNGQVKTFSQSIDATWFSGGKEKVADLSGLPSGEASVSVQVYNAQNHVIGHSVQRGFFGPQAMVNLADGDSDVPITLENGRRSLLRINIVLSGEGHTNLRPITQIGNEWVDYSLIGTLKNASGSYMNIAAMTQDATGDFYLIDGERSGIYKVPQNGTASFIPIIGLNIPTDIACDATGSLYIADNLNFDGSIKKISDATASTIATLSAGIDHLSCTASGAIAVLTYSEAYRLTGNKWSAPISLGAGIHNGLVEDSQGNLFVLESSYSDNHSVIYKIAKDNTKTIFVGGPSGDYDGTGTSARFSFLRSITIDAQDNLYVGDEYKIRKITPAGVVTTIQSLTSGMPGELTILNGDIFHTSMSYEAGNLFAVINRLHLE